VASKQKEDWPWPSKLHNSMWLFSRFAQITLIVHAQLPGSYHDSG
jgi:hypothetical protein